MPRMRLFLPSFVLICSVFAYPQSVKHTSPRHDIDVGHSVVTVHAFKSGLFSGFAHDHEINAPIATGFIDEAAPGRVDFTVEVGRMKVLDPKLAADKRAEVQQTMLGKSVLDSKAYPEIRFASTQVRETGNNHWMVTGNLTLHGQTHPVTADVSRSKGRYSGFATLSQRDFGIKPISVAGGTIKVKDQIKIDFDIETKQR